MSRNVLLFTLVLSSGLSAYGAEKETLKDIDGDLIEGSGSALIEGPNGTVLVLTGGVLTSKTNDSVTVDDKTIPVIPATRVCAKTGQRIALKALRVGEKVLVVSAPEEKHARTIRVGRMLSRLTKDGDIERVNNYTCK